MCKCDAWLCSLCHTSGFSLFPETKFGSPFLSAIVEFDDRPGKVRDHILKLQSRMIATFEKAVAIAQEEGQIAPKLDNEQIAYELYSNMIGFHVYNRLLKNKAAEKMFEQTFQALIERSHP